MKRIVTILTFALAFMICGFTNPLADPGRMAEPHAATPRQGAISSAPAQLPPLALPSMHEGDARFQPCAEALPAQPVRHSVRLKVAAKVYANPYSEANRRLTPVSGFDSGLDSAPAIPQPDLHSQAPARSKAPVAARLSARSLLHLAERCVTGQGAPVLWAA